MSESLNPVSRREFALRAAAAAAAPLAVVGSEAAVAADEKEKGPEARPPHELLLDVLRQKFPHEKLTAETLELMRADIAGDLGRYFALDKFPLKNGDEPGFVFAAWRGSV